MSAKLTFEFAATGSDLVAQQILLVEEENDGNGLEPAIVPNRLKQRQRLSQPILRVVLAQRHIVGAGCDHYVDVLSFDKIRASSKTENNGGDIVEALDPLPPLVALAAHVKHVEVDFFDAELGLEDALRQHTTAQHILLGRFVVWRAYNCDLIEKVFGTVDELVLVGAFVTVLDAPVAPQSIEMFVELVRVV